ncbi:aquaporin PIP [Marchantia polymorpha subsp. ruderalis]|uniref:Aquaporin n=2 Tax=Marchantia polymorpha TaxID=3197 RepID=A0AAF6B6B4_MARPO|nr:hypothetical protein MARPO_0044s0028 [Marchantia polymorpha]BBN07548.1 hypothetical protein Mp_4g04450 [Marchantia polymorpha subsp. ruderalis]|eukprot:PTQ39552.1 hypothetical protein MARPO_0044s0028 [Marchantia polymorpha]
MASMQDQGDIVAALEIEGREFGPAASSYNKKICGSAAQTGEKGQEHLEPAPYPTWAVEELYKWSLYRAAIAEFVATLLFVYIGVSAAIGNARDSPEGVGALGVAWAFGAAIFVLYYCTAGVSSESASREPLGHINPAVTFGLLLGRRLSIPRALLYMVAQVLGGICGAGLVKALQKRPFQRYNGGTNFVAQDLSASTGLAAEIIGTFVLVYVVYSATDGKRRARDSHIPCLWYIWLQSQLQGRESTLHEALVLLFCGVTSSPGTTSGSSGWVLSSALLWQPLTTNSSSDLFHRDLVSSSPPFL